MLEFTDKELQAAAERLRMVEPGQPVPRNLRSKVAAVLTDERRVGQNDVSDVPPPAMAREVVVQPGSQILVDGQPFPWLVADERIDIALHPDPGGVSTVRMTLLAESVQIIKPNPIESEKAS